MTTVLQRYPISQGVRRIDRWMTSFIRIGGLGIVCAVFGIFVFILSQVIPLFRHASAFHDQTWSIPPADYCALDADENGALPFLVTLDGRVLFVRTAESNFVWRHLPFSDNEQTASIAYHTGDKRIIVGTDHGRIYEFRVVYTNENNGSTPQLEPHIVTAGSYTVGAPDARVIAADLHGSSERRLCLFSLSVSNVTAIKAIQLQQRRTLIGKANWNVTKEWNLTEQFAVEPVRFSVNGRGDGAVAVRRDGKVSYFELTGAEFELVQQFYPFTEDKAQGIVIAEYVFGDDSIVFAHQSSEVVGYSLYKQGESARRRWGMTKKFAPMISTPRTYAASQRNKSFLLGSDNALSIRHFTTGAVRWEQIWPKGARLVALGTKQNMFWVLDRSDPPQIHRFILKDPHPEAGLAGFFGKIWYEGGSEPKYEWQSTGGSDDFEPKLSMVPLIVGTLKGTLYAMLFSTPLALLAALYTSQFAHPNLRRFIKPTLELMASLPSVILGFLAALWLAPLLEQRIPSVLLVLIAVPLTAVVAGEMWTHLPVRWRSRIPMGYEFLVLVPILLLVVSLAWTAGPWLERLVFVARDRQTGLAIPDFRLWWTQTFDLPFEQRNSLVVGFMMGFAVIPIIFTIAEDALSNVPQAMRSASLALGGTRWQTALRIVCPTASAGIFSAIMVGFGRAVGETMIVLMATGNTPVMSMNIFSGMRTLSANIAVELPEAPHHSTLYRALFLGALLLFLMTFTVNTIAELLRHRLREKYKMA